MILEEKGTITDGMPTASTAVQIARRHAEYVGDFIVGHAHKIRDFISNRAHQALARLFDDEKLGSRLPAVGHEFFLNKPGGWE